MNPLFGLPTAYFEPPPSVNTALLPNQDGALYQNSFQNSTPVQTVESLNSQLNNNDYKNFRDNFPQTAVSARDFNMMKEILGHKINYDAAEKARNEQQRFIDNASSDVDTTQFRRAVDYNTVKMNDAANSAALLRNISKSMGYNVSGVAEDVPLTKAVENLRLAGTQGLQSLLDSPSTQRQASELYYNLISQGKSARDAKAISNFMADRYREDNIQKMIEGIGAYGLNEDGALNNAGTMILNKLAVESPNVANLYLANYATPKDDYATAANMVANAANSQSAWDRLMAQLNTTRDIAANNLQQQINESNAQNAYKDARIAIDTQNTYNQTPMGQYENWFKVGQMMYGNDEEGNKKAAEFAQSRFINRDNSDADKQIELRNEVLRGLSNRLQVARNYLLAKDKESAQNVVDALKESLNNPDFKGLGILPSEVITSAMEEIQKYQRVINDEIPPEELQRILEGSKSAADLSKVNNDTGANSNAKKTNSTNNNSNVDNNVSVNKDSNNNSAIPIRDITDNMIYNGRGYYSWRNPNPQQNSNLRQFQIIPQIIVDSNGTRIVTNWKDLPDDQKLELRKAGYYGS